MIKSLRILGILVVSLHLPTIVRAGEVKCGGAPEAYTSRQLFYDVAGTGRLYLYSGPDEKCLDKNVFVVPGDNLVAYGEAGKNAEWSYVSYTAKNGKDYQGWVFTNRLRFTGASGNEMSPAEIAFYTKAQEAAKKGKLGRPE